MAEKKSSFGGWLMERFKKKKEPVKNADSFYELDDDNEEGVNEKSLYGAIEEVKPNAGYYGMNEESTEKPKPISVFHFQWWEYSVFAVEIVLVVYTLLVLIGIAPI